MTKIEVLRQIQEILRAKCDEPAEELIKTGEALVAIGKALRGQSVQDARAILRSVAALGGE